MFIEAKDDGGGGNNWSYKSCKAPVKSSPPTNQHPVFLQADALPVALPTASKHWRRSISSWQTRHQVTDNFCLLLSNSIRRSGTVATIPGQCHAASEKRPSNLEQSLLQKHRPARLKSETFWWTGGSHASQFGQAIKLFQITPYANDFQTLKTVIGKFNRTVLCPQQSRFLTACRRLWN